MGRKPKAQGPTGAPSKRKMTPEEQSELFIKTARELGVDETGEAFERAFDAIVKPSPSKRKGKKPSR